MAQGRAFFSARTPETESRDQQKNITTNGVKTMQIRHNHRSKQASKSLGRTTPLALAATFAAALMSASPAQAASVSYFLDQSNRLPDWTNDYLKVTIDDQGALGAINFTVETLDALSARACKKFGILSFGFNGAELDKENIFDLPDGWKFKNDKKMDGFGKFENVLIGKKWDRQDPLTFSIVGIDGDSIYSYAASHGKSDGVLFSAYAGGLERNKHGKWRDDDCHRCTKGAYFGGGEPAPVPLPAAAWLFGSGLLGLIGVARRKRRLRNA